MDKWLWSEEKGCYLDWNFVTEKHSPCVSVASLFPLYLGLSHDPKLLMETLENEMLLPYGVTGTVKPLHPFQLQWEYPNIWAPLQYVAYTGCGHFRKIYEIIREQFLKDRKFVGKI